MADMKSEMADMKSEAEMLRKQLEEVINTLQTLLGSTTAAPTTAAPVPPVPAVRCTDRKDQFELNGTTRKWCLWLGNRFPDPADQLKQCIRKSLTDHCPEVCQKPECFATDSPTTAAPVPPIPAVRCADRKDEFQWKDITRKWCIWVRNKFPDPADQLKQCIRRNLTDHCPELCQKPECL